MSRIAETARYLEHLFLGGEVEHQEVLVAGSSARALLDMGTELEVVPVAGQADHGYLAAVAARAVELGQSQVDTVERQPAKAFALAQRLEIHHTPKHGSWLNIAEIELSALTRQCLDRRIAELDIFNAELAACQNTTNTNQRQVNWQLTAKDARTKLKHLYPEN